MEKGTNALWGSFKKYVTWRGGVDNNCDKKWHGKGKGCNRKGDVTHTAHFSCNSIFSSLVYDPVLIIKQ